jgi:hypothetical protein
MNAFESSATAGKRCLLVILRPTLTLSSVDVWPLSEIRIDKTDYLDTGLGEWTGFYDWLRCDDGMVMGVRYWPAIPNNPLFDAARSLPYVTIGTAGSLDITFSPSKKFDPTQSQDQEFMYDAVFRSKTGEWAIAFDTMALKENDWEHLRQLPATWSESQIIQH